MFELDEISHLITVDTDLKIHEIEKGLHSLGYTLGYFFSPDNDVILEEALGKNLPNLYSLFYGSIKELCVAIHLESKSESVISTKVVPRQATGPNWKNLILGTGRKLGLIYRAVMKIFPLTSSLTYTVIPRLGEEDSYHMERALTRREMIPRSFGRYTRTHLARILKSTEGGLFLCLEWACHENLGKALQQELAHFLKKEKIHFDTVERPEQKQGLMRMLKKFPPGVPWGGALEGVESPQALALEKKIVESLS